MGKEPFTIPKADVIDKLPEIIRIYVYNVYKNSNWLPRGYPTTLATCIKKYADLKKGKETFINYPNSYSFTPTHFFDPNLNIRYST